MQRDAAKKILEALKEEPSSWARVDAVLEESQSMLTKFFALQVRAAWKRKRRKSRDKDGHELTNGRMLEM